MTDKDDAYWREKLTADEYHVLRQKGTERAFTGEYWDTTDAGTYKCRACGEVLFQSESKFDAGCGWPSFDRPAADAAVAEERDTSAAWFALRWFATTVEATLGMSSPMDLRKQGYATVSTACRSILRGTDRSAIFGIIGFLNLISDADQGISVSALELLEICSKGFLLMELPFVNLQPRSLPQGTRASVVSMPLSSR